MAVIAWKNVSFTSLEIFVTISNTVFLTYLYFMYRNGKGDYDRFKNKSNNNNNKSQFPTKPARKRNERNRSTASCGSITIDGDERYHITTVEQLRSVIPPSSSAGSSLDNAKKVIDFLDDQMKQFVEQSPMVLLGTSAPIDDNACVTNGENDQDIPIAMPFVSPKGGDPGFCKLQNSTSTTSDNSTTTTIWIPDSPGNQLLFGLQNILENPSIALCFLIPGSPTTLRVMGSAYITRKPSAWKREDRPKIAICVQVQHAFFHCGKAFARSKLWDHDTWPKKAQEIDWEKYVGK